MLSIRLVVVGLLALSGVHAKHKDKVGVVEFGKDGCNGRPSSGLKEFKRNKCYFLSAPHVRFEPPHKPKHDGWHNRDCHVKIFEGYGCQWDKHQKEVSVPADFNKCTSLDSKITSAMFVCQYASRNSEGIHNHTMELPAASHSVNRRADDSELTLTETANRHSDSDADITPRAEPTGDAKLEVRGKHNKLGVWMLHPWEKYPICYLCWTKHDSVDSKLKCRSGPKYVHEANCGPKPPSVPHTSSHAVSTTTTSTVQWFFTTPDQRKGTRTITQKPTATTPLERRSPHTPVVFKHPYVGDKLVCADAEWENKGKWKAEVRLQHVKQYAKCSSNAILLNYAEPLHTKSYTTTATTTASVTLTTPPA